MLNGHWHLSEDRPSHLTVLAKTVFVIPSGGGEGGPSTSLRMNSAAEAAGVEESPAFDRFSRRDSEIPRLARNE
jgi:hypothetical protein